MCQGSTSDKSSYGEGDGIADSEELLLAGVVWSGKLSKKREFGLTDKLTGIFIITQLAVLLRDFILFQTRGLNCCNSFFFLRFNLSNLYT